METAAVTCARHSGLQRKILRIYLRTNKIMMVLLTLTDPPSSGFCPSPFYQALLAPPNLFSASHPLLSFPFPPIILFLCPFLGLSLTFSHGFCLAMFLHHSPCLCSP